MLFRSKLHLFMVEMSWMAVDVHIDIAKLMNLMTFFRECKFLSKWENEF